MNYCKFHGLTDKFRLVLAVIAVIVLTSGTIFAKTVTGTVNDASGEPVIGASVMVKGTTTGTATNFDGQFSINVANDNATLVISYVGYKTQEVSVAGKTNVQVTLEENAEILDEVVVVGYGVQRKVDVTGATASVSGKDLVAMPVKNALEGMQGKAAGVDITTSQRPGEVGDIRIRGERSLNASNSPLYVVDGMVIQNGGIENLNPQDIESIDVLKDASATAIYGSRGANGVILVTTKQGQNGKISVSYSGSVTFETLHNETPMMSAAKWLDYSRYANYRAGSYPVNPFGADGPSYAGDQALFGTIASSWANVDQAWVNGKYNPDLVGTYNWTDGGKQTGVTNEHTVSISGGTDRFRGYASFGYLHQKGVTPGQEYSRYTMKASFDLTPKDWIFNMGVNINGSYGVQDYGYSFSKSVTGPGDLYSALQGMLPWTVPYDENGAFIRNPNGDVNIINPIEENKYTTNNRKTFRANGLVYGQLDFAKIWAPLQGLTYRIQFGPEFTYYTYGLANNADGINGDGSNKATYNQNQRRSWTLDNLINYNRTFGKHRVGVTLLQSASEMKYEYGNMNAYVATPEELWYNLASAGDIKGYGTGLTETQMTSYMGRVNYSFDDRYLLTASMRWDGSSVLASGHKWASFPSVALAWRVSEESFLKDVDWLTNLKLRLGYGQTGNAAISAYSTKGGITTINYPFGPNNYTGYVPSNPGDKKPVALANQDLKWERTTQWNVGLDFAVLNGRLSGTIDWYKTSTKDLLMDMLIPSLNGYQTTMANVGSTSGYGWDIQLNSINIQNRDFRWETSLTWSMDRNKIESLANGNKQDINKLWFVGERLGVYYDYVYDGVWKTSEAEEAAKYGRKPGDIRVKDLNDDGSIDPNNDRKIVGNSRPDWTAGMTNRFFYKDFDFSFFILARWGFKMPQGAETLDGRYMKRDLDYWIEGINEDAKYPAPLYNSTKDAYEASMNYTDGSFIKVRNISLGYTVPTKALKSLGVGLSSIRIYAQMNNPFFIYKKCSWLDPDLVNYNNNAKVFGSSTTTRSYVIGLNINF